MLKYPPSITRNVNDEDVQSAAQFAFEVLARQNPTDIPVELIRVVHATSVDVAGVAYSLDLELEQGDNVCINKVRVFRKVGGDFVFTANDVVQADAPVPQNNWRFAVPY